MAGKWRRKIMGGKTFFAADAVGWFAGEAWFF
jgi:hypothetical protein